MITKIVKNYRSSAAKIKLPFGLNENNILVHIADAERGKKCSCVCPSCRSPLIAARGSQKQHHFRHDTDRECEGGLESAIHLAAKQILMEKKQMTLPKCISSATAKDSRGAEHSEHETVVSDGTAIRFDVVQEEAEIHGMKADILATKGDALLVIEIFYRHKVDDQKWLKIVNANVSAIEVDLSDLTPEDVKDWDTFWSSINNPQRIKWLHNAKAHHTVYQRLENKLAEKIQAQENRYKQEEIEKQRREEKEKAQLLQALDDFKALRSEDHIQQLKQNAETHPVWEKYRKYTPFSWHELPDFLNADAPYADWIFGCDRRIWQTAFYSSIICKTGASFSVKTVDDWLQNKVGCKVPHSVTIVGMYGRRYPLLLPADISSNPPSSWRTLKEYFWYLRDLGMVEFTGDDWKNPGSDWFRVISKNPGAGIPLMHSEPIKQTPKVPEIKNIGRPESKPDTKKYYLKTNKSDAVRRGSNRIDQ